MVDIVDENGVTSQRSLSVDDRYLRIEGGYSFRPLRIVTEFSLRVGIVRGESPVPTGELAPGQDESERFQVGLNYGAATARFRLHDEIHFEGEFLTSVTEVGFSVGAGGAVLLGDPHGTRLTLGFESIQVFGVRFYSSLSTVILDGVVLSPVVEVTDMPHAAEFGLRLLGELSVDVGSGITVAGRGGYQARVFTEGGPSFGLGVAYAF